MTANTMNLAKIILRRLRMKLKIPFTTSFGTTEYKEFFLIEMIDQDGNNGWGESVAFSAPWYTEETVKTNQHMMADFLIPFLFAAPIEHPDEVRARFNPVKRNNMAKAALEGAVWDLYAKRNNLTLAKALGGEKPKINVGISIGIQPTTRDLLDMIHGYLAAGYKRVKVKIKPGADIDVVKEIRRHFPDVPLMVDANSAYTLHDIDHLKQLDAYHLMMIEQPLAHDDIMDHAQLQQHLSTPICLDESIHSWDDARKAIALGSCKIINIKSGRVGGLTEAKRIHDLCAQKGIAVWCGGMLEAGIGRAQNIALSTLSQFTLPGDIAGSAYYWKEDIISPEVVVKDGSIDVPGGPGIGYDVDEGIVEKHMIDKKVFDADLSF